MTNVEVVHAYRHLYRGLLQAIQYAKPARYAVHAVIRQAFREKGATLDKEAVKRTVWFLEAATKERGLEHRILKNLIYVRQRNRIGMETWKGAYSRTKQNYAFNKDIDKSLEHYNTTITMLNKTMGLCLR